ncbi:MAG: VPLPA-CTERM sorting domain-containing protein [Pseudomonadales bacterium]|nr:VPLPA-CTERM sorting domain-containing protein [Pseudomonadales bacterium]MDG2078867.1 VPLPA-CTERM sorting domain-containing protein [Pseudomonadales bacterium]
MRLSTLFSACALAVCLPLQAAEVSVDGTDVTFTYDDSTLFGPAFVVGNSIFFTPTTFLAQSANVEGAVQSTATLNIDVQVKSGSTYLMDGFQLMELGDYLLTGNGSASAQAVARLQVISKTTTCGLMGSPVCIVADTDDTGVLTAQNALTDWDLYAEVNYGAMWGPDTHVEAQIQNTLTATSTVSGDSSLVQKKFNGVGLVVVEAIPIPATAWLFGSALAGLVVARRKHR